MGKSDRDFRKFKRVGNEFYPLISNFEAAEVDFFRKQW